MQNVVIDKPDLMLDVLDSAMNNFCRHHHKRRAAVLLRDDKRQGVNMCAVFLGAQIHLPEKRLVYFPIDQRFDIQVCVELTLDRKCLNEVKCEGMRSHEIAGHVNFPSCL